MTQGKLAVCCKFVLEGGDNDPRFRFLSLTRQNYRRTGDQRLREVAFHNARTLYELVCMLGRCHPRRRMFRVGNHVFPCLTLPEAMHVYRDPGFVRELGNAYHVIGARARRDGVRLSTHPDQFIVPNSKNPDVRTRSVLELDHWAAWVERMGLSERDGFCMNVHLAPGFDSSREVETSWYLARRLMSRAAWRILTVENNDRQWTAGTLIRVAREVGFRPVVDVHHEFCVTGRWPYPEHLIERVLPLWNGLRPKIHFSLPKPEYYRPEDMGSHGLPLAGRATGPIRPHARMPWAPGAAAYVDRLLEGFDIAVELKDKNLAVDKLWSDMDAIRHAAKSRNSSRPTLR